MRLSEVNRITALRLFKIGWAKPFCLSGKSVYLWESKTHERRVSMPFKTLLVALPLALLPVLSHAGCSERGHQAQSCAPGSVWDVATQSCVKQVSS